MATITQAFLAGLDADATCRDLARDLLECGGVVLCGAGISNDGPTGLPLGGDVNELFLTTIRDAALMVGGKVAGLADEGELGFIRNMLPERVLSAFYAVFGYRVFRFLDGFSAQCPNLNHRAIVGLAEAGILSNIFTLNFDLALEQAWYNLTDVWPGSPTNYEAARRTTGRAIEKPHGTLNRAVTGDLARRYETLRFSLETVRSARDEVLERWLGNAMRGRVLLVTGYSAGDIDIFPALRAAATGCEKVYWSCYDGEADLLGSKHRTLRRWLEDINASVLDGPIARYLPGIAASCGVALPTAGDEKCEPLQGFSLAHIADDPHGVMLGAALVLHESNTPGQHRWIDPILKSLRRERRRRREGMCRHDIMLNQLRGARLHEAGKRARATLYYHRVHDQLRRRRRARKRDDQIAMEVTTDQAAARLCYQHVSRLREDFRLARILPAMLALLRLLWIGPLSYRRKDRDARGLATHFFAEAPQQLAFLGDKGSAPARWRRALYDIALYFFRLATARSEGWRPFQAFHDLRRDEVWLLRNRGSPGIADDPRYQEWLKAMDHYEYLREVIGGDIGYQLVLLVRALQSASIDGDKRKARAYLRLASCVYRARKDSAGLRRLEAYRRLCGVD